MTPSVDVHFICAEVSGSPLSQNKSSTLPYKDEIRVESEGLDMGISSSLVDQLSHLIFDAQKILEEQSVHSSYGSLSRDCTTIVSVPLTEGHFDIELRKIILSRVRPVNVTLKLPQVGAQKPVVALELTPATLAGPKSKIKNLIAVKTFSNYTLYHYYCTYDVFVSLKHSSPY